MNVSLTNFVNMKKLALRVGIISFGVGVLFLLLSMGGGTSQKCVPDLIYGGQTCDTVVNAPNTVGLAFGGFLVGVSGLALNLWIISAFLIQTSKSIIEGMGGNFETPIVVKEEKPAE